MRAVILVLTLLWLLLAQGSLFASEGDEPLRLLDEAGKKPQNTGQQVPQPSLPPQIGQPAAEPMKMYDIYGVVPIKTPLPYGSIGIAILIALLLAALIYWLYKRTKRPLPVSVIPPWDRALTELKDARTLFTKGQGRDYMARASQILRQYVEERFAIKTTRQTTREFLGSLKHSNDSAMSSYKNELQQCLEQADMAKFAHKSHDEESLAVMEQAVSTFVHATKPPESGEAEK